SQSDQQVLGLGGNEACEQLLEPSSRVLGGTASAGGEVCQLHAPGFDVQRSPPRVEPPNLGVVTAFVYRVRSVHPCYVPVTASIPRRRERDNTGEPGGSAVLSGERRSLAVPRRQVLRGERGTFRLAGMAHGQSRSGHGWLG